MAQRQTIALTERQKKELEQIRDHDARPWARERCAAILKIATGKSPYWVARKGLLKERDPDTVYFWMKLYKEGGAEKLLTRQPGGVRRRRL